MKTFARDSNRGMTLVEVLVAAGLVGGLAAVLSTTMRSNQESNARLQTAASLVSMREQLGVARADLKGWLKIEKDNVSEVESCLVSTGAVCPPAVSILSTEDSVLSAYSTGKTISEVELYDLNGLLIAGRASSASQVNFDLNGLPCVDETGSECRFRAHGYMLRDNATGSPGNVTFLRKVALAPGKARPGEPPPRPLYERLSLGTSWGAPVSFGPAVGSIVAYAGSAGDIPDGYLLADGSELEISSHPQLHDALGSLWGAAAAGRFRLPDLRGVFLRGSSVTQAFGVRQAADVMRHTHTNLPMTASGSVSMRRISAQANGSLSTVSGAMVYFSAGGSFDGVAGYGVCMNPVSVGNMVPANSTATVATPSGFLGVNANQVRNLVVSFVADATVGTGETRPSNSAVVYLVRDDYE